MKDDTREFVPGTVFRDADPTTQYWIRDGKVMYRRHPVRGADAETFRFYLGHFAKDKNNCYCTWSKLSGGNAATFRALNFTYATDGHSVSTMGGRIKEADGASFVVCDDGEHFFHDGSRVPYGYGKDKDRVFYYDFNGKPNWVRKASPKTFVSLNDGQFGKDHQFVFCGTNTLPKAKVEHWQKIGGHYSRDDERVYYFNREIKEADLATFEVVQPSLPSLGFLQLARDKNHYYSNDRIVDQLQFEKQLKGEFDAF